jgi:hypothetical protein
MHVLSVLRPLRMIGERLQLERIPKMNISARTHVSMYNQFNDYRRRVEPVDPVVGVCFSGSSTVQVHKKGQVALSPVQIGDLVHVGNGKYEPVYSFGHYDPTS